MVSVSAIGAHHLIGRMENQSLILLSNAVLAKRRNKGRTLARGSSGPDEQCVFVASPAVSGHKLSIGALT